MARRSRLERAVPAGARRCGLRSSAWMGAPAGAESVRSSRLCATWEVVYVVHGVRCTAALRQCGPLGGANRQALATLKQCKHNGFPVIRVMDSVDEEEATGRSSAEIRHSVAVSFAGKRMAWHWGNKAVPARCAVIGASSVKPT